MTAQPHNHFVFCVVVVKFTVNGNQALVLFWISFCFQTEELNIIEYNSRQFV